MGLYIFILLLTLPTTFASNNPFVEKAESAIVTRKLNTVHFNVEETLLTFEIDLLHTFNEGFKMEKQVISTCEQFNKAANKTSDANRRMKELWYILSDNCNLIWHGLHESLEDLTSTTTILLGGEPAIKTNTIFRKFPKRLAASARQINYHDSRQFEFANALLYHTNASSPLRTKSKRQVGIALALLAGGTGMYLAKEFAGDSVTPTEYNNLVHAVEDSEHRLSLDEDRMLALTGAIKSISEAAETELLISDNSLDLHLAVTDLIRHINRVNTDIGQAMRGDFPHHIVTAKGLSDSLAAIKTKLRQTNRMLIFDHPASIYNSPISITIDPRTLQADIYAALPTKPRDQEPMTLSRLIIFPSQFPSNSSYYLPSPSSDLVAHNQKFSLIHAVFPSDLLRCKEIRTELVCPHDYTYFLRQDKCAQALTSGTQNQLFDNCPLHVTTDPGLMVEEISYLTYLIFTPIETVVTVRCTNPPVELAQRITGTFKLRSRRNCITYIDSITLTSHHTPLEYSIRAARLLDIQTGFTDSDLLHLDGKIGRLRNLSRSHHLDFKTTLADLRDHEETHLLHAEHHRTAAYFILLVAIIAIGLLLIAGVTATLYRRYGLEPCIPCSCFPTCFKMSDKKSNTTILFSDLKAQGTEEERRQLEAKANAPPRQNPPETVDTDEAANAALEQLINDYQAKKNKK